MKCAVAAGLDSLDPDICRAFLSRRLHPAGARCPDCGLALDGTQADTFRAGGRVHCNGCSRWFTWRTDTLLQVSTADERQIFMIALLSGVGSDPVEISAACQLSIDTVRTWQQRFRKGCR